jgi:response regulator RpfG family c-di-GMP phosphodiesterase
MSSQPVEAPPPSPRTVLCVDDEANILSALRRLLRPHGFQVIVAESGQAGLAVLESTPVDLVISDMRMPEMDGSKFLEHVRERWPDTMRLLLTGYADVSSIIEAINRGEIYRYITKPWDDHDLILIVQQALERKALEREKKKLEEQVLLQNEELKTLNSGLEAKVQARTQELQAANGKLKKNYLNTIKVFSNLMELRGGNLSGHSRMVADLARRTAVSMGLPDAAQQELFVAGLLHDIGQIGLSDEVLSKPVGRLSESELTLYRRHPVWGEQALLSQDDMYGVAALIRSHHERYDGLGFPDGLAGDAISIAASILVVVEAFLDLQAGNLSQAKLSTAEARSMIARGRGTQFNPEVVDVFLQVTLNAAPVMEAPAIMLKTSELVPGMVMARDLKTHDGIVLLSAEHVLTEKLIKLLQQRESRDDIEMVLPIKPPQKK